MMKRWKKVTRKKATEVIMQRYYNENMYVVKKRKAPLSF